MGEMAQQAANFQQLVSGCECMQSAAQIMGDMLGGGIVGEAMQQAAQQCALTAINAMAASIKSYVVHGAYTVCEHGSRKARLIVPISHGVYLRGKAQLNKGDYLPGKNVTPMGVCTAGYSNICAEQEQAKNEKKSFSFSFMSKSEKNAAKEAQINRATSSVTICTYMPLTAWLETKEDVFVDGKEALLNTSYLICTKGGKVTILDDGQYS
ncbi:MAG TPA: DUF4280 domain-containing protein [Candidatus Coprocola pullicola]|nr:DUF4280 domain-containing protein [Candidatus Coprocola pullicola]